MNEEKKYFGKQQNIIIEKLIIDNGEKEEQDTKSPNNFAFNLEYQKIINSPDGQPKIATELKKLIDFVKNRYFYRDINGNRITPKGELLPTPFQKLKKINEEIKNYYDYKLNRKNSPFIVQNFRRNNLFNTLSYTKKKKLKKFFPSKKNERLNFNQFINNYKPLKNKSFKSNINIIINNTINENNNNENVIGNINSNRICLSETFNKNIINNNYDSNFNHINFLRNKFWYNQKINDCNCRDNLQDNKSNFNHYITEYNKRKKENKIFNMYRSNKMDKKDSFLDKNHYSYTMNNITKRKDFSNHLNKYNLIQFNINQLIKKDNKNRIIINMRKAPNSLRTKKIMINKNINVNIDNNNNLKNNNPGLIFNNFDFKNQIKKHNTIGKHKSFDVLKPEIKLLDKGKMSMNI